MTVKVACQHFKQGSRITFSSYEIEDILGIAIEALTCAAPQCDAFEILAQVEWCIKDYFVGRELRGV